MCLIVSREVQSVLCFENKEIKSLRHQKKKKRLHAPATEINAQLGENLERRGQKTPEGRRPLVAAFHLYK